MCVVQRSLTKNTTRINDAKEMKTEREHFYHVSLIVQWASAKQCM
jgi:hypothetical protein